MANRFVDTTIKNILMDNVISDMFPNLITEHKILLHKYLVRLVDLLSVTFNFNNDNNYVHQLRQNNFQDIKWLLLHLLPFINDDGTKLKDIVNLNDIYSVKIIDEDINKHSPVYKFSNIQYGRNIRGEISTEIKFSESHIQHNFYLLCMTLVEMSNKLHVNWIDVMPVVYSDYNGKGKYSDVYNSALKLFLNTNEKISNSKGNQYNNFNPISDIVIDETKFNFNNLYNDFSSLYIGDIYNTISIYLFDDIKNIKWMIYDICIDNLSQDRDGNLKTVLRPAIYVLYFCAKEFFGSGDNPLTYSLRNIEWDQLTKTDKYNYMLFWKNIVLTTKEFGEIKLSDEAQLSIKNVSLKRLLTSIIINFEAKYAKKYEDDMNKAGYVFFNSDDTQVQNDDEDEDEENLSVIDMHKYVKSFDSLLTEKNIKFLYEHFLTCFQMFKKTLYGHVILTQDMKYIKEDLLVYPYDVVLDRFDTYSERIKKRITLKNIYNFAKSIISYTKEYFIQGDDGKKQKVTRYIQFNKHWKSLSDENKNIFINRLNGFSTSTGKIPVEILQNGEKNVWFNLSGYFTYVLYNSENDYDINDLKQANNATKYVPPHKKSAELKKAIREITERKNFELYMNIKYKLTKIIFDCLVQKGVLSKFRPNKAITDKAYSSRDRANKVNANTIFNGDNTLIFEESDKNKYYVEAYNYHTEQAYKYMPKYYKNGKELTYFKNNTNDAWYSMAALDWISQIGFCHRFIHKRVSYITGSTGVGKSTLIPVLFTYYLKALDYNSKGKVVCSQPRKNPTEKNSKWVSQFLGVPREDEIKNETTDRIVPTPTNNFYVQMQHSDDKHIKRRIDHLSLKYMTDGSLVKELINPLLKISIERKNTSSNKDMIDYMTENIYDVIIIDEAHEHNTYMDLILTQVRSSVYFNNSVRLVILSATMDEDEPVYRRFYRDINDNRKYPLDCIIKNAKLDRINVDRRYHISAPGITTRFSVNDIYYTNRNRKEVIHEIVKSNMQGDILIFEPGKKEIDTLIGELNNDPQIPQHVIAIPYHSKLENTKKEFVEKIHEQIGKLRINKTSNFEDGDIFTGDGKYKNFIMVATNIAEASITIDTLSYVIETGTQKIQMYDYKKRNSMIVETPISESSRLQRRGRVGRRKEGTVYYLYKMGDMENNKTQYKIVLENISQELFNNLRKSPNDKLIIPENLDPNFFSNITNGYKLELMDSKIDDIIYLQYFTEEGFYDYYGVDNHYDYNNQERYDGQYKSENTTGYSLKTLTDDEGRFYIIHPDELNLKRNINGKITGVIGDDVEFIKYDNKTYGKIKSKKIQSFWDDYLFGGYIKKVADNDIEKTYFGEFIAYCSEVLQLSDKQKQLTMVYAILFGCHEDVIRLLALMANISSIRELLLLDESYRYNFNEVKDQLNKQKYIDSDIFALQLLLNSLHEQLDINKANFDINRIAQFIQLELLSSSKDKHKNTKISADRIKSILTKHVDPEQLNMEKVDREKLLKGYIKFVMSDPNNNKLINRWVRENNLSVEPFKEYLKTYIILKDKVNTLFNSEQQKHKKYTKYLVGLSKYIQSNISTTIDKVRLSFLMGHLFNVCKNVVGTNSYISVYNPGIDSVYTIAPLTKKKLDPLTFVQDIYQKNYIFYISVDIDDNYMSFINYITLEYLNYISAIYNKKTLASIIKAISMSNKIQKYVSDKKSKPNENDYNVLIRLELVLRSIVADVPDIAVTKINFNYMPQITQSDEDSKSYTKQITIIKKNTLRKFR